MEKLLSHLDSIQPLSKPLLTHLRSTLETKVLKKKEFLLKKGRVCNYINFIESGMLRCFYEHHGAEVTSWIMTENHVVISVSSFFQQSPSKESILAMEGTTLHGISYPQLQHIYQMYPEFNCHGRVLTETYYALCEDRLYGIRMHRAHERYTYLNQTQPELLARVPAKYIASYLGITEETLSRIRANY